MADYKVQLYLMSATTHSNVIEQNKNRSTCMTYIHTHGIESPGFFRFLPIICLFCDSANDYLGTIMDACTSIICTLYYPLPLKTYSV